MWYFNCILKNPWHLENDHYKVSYGIILIYMHFDTILLDSINAYNFYYFIQDISFQYFFSIFLDTVDAKEYTSFI